MSEVCVTGSVQEQNKTDTRGNDLREFFTVGKGLTSEKEENLAERGITPVLLSGISIIVPRNCVHRVNDEGP